MDNYRKELLTNSSIEELVEYNVNIGNFSKAIDLKGSDTDLQSFKTTR
jgi:hypothetical protein